MKGACEKRHHGLSLHSSAREGGVYTGTGGRKIPRGQLCLVALGTAAAHLGQHSAAQAWDGPRFPTTALHLHHLSFWTQHTGGTFDSPGIPLTSSLLGSLPPWLSRKFLYGVG